MRILFVIPYFYPAWAYGGAVTASYEIARYLTKAGHEVTVYTTDAYDGISRVSEKKNCPIDQDGIKVYYFKNLSNTLAYRYKLFLPEQITRTFAMECNNFDIIHLHEYYTTVNILIANSRHRKQNEKLYILSANGSAFPLKERGNCIRKHIFNFLFGYKILNNAAKLIAYTDIEKKQLMDMGVSAQKIAIIPTGIDVSRFKILPTGDRFREKFGIKSNEKIILFVGRLHRIKRVDLLIRAFSLLAKDFDSARLLIVGPDEEYGGALKRLCDNLNVTKKVIFTGFVTEEEKLAAYVASDVCVLPSINDVFGMSLLEACTCGKPVIATDGVGLSSVIQEWKAGLKVKGDEENLKSAMLDIISNVDKAEELGRNGKKMVNDLFSWDAIGKKFEALYHEVITDR